MNERLEMTVKFQVTEAQALALQAMFKDWNFLASIGASRFSAFYVDGDGNFQPNCTFEFARPIQELTKELRELAVLKDAIVRRDELTRFYDFDNIAYRINHGRP
jgi:hypothetical protein